MFRKTALSLLLIAVITVTITNCDSASATEYKQKYYRQVAITDSIALSMIKLNKLIDSIHVTSIKRIDSLKVVIAKKDSIINLGTANVNVMLQSIQNGLETMSQSALQYLISIQRR